ANNALADMTGRAPEEMMGMGADDLGFRQDNSSADAPWHHAIRTGRPQANISMQLADETGVQILKVNCSPLRGNEGQYRSVMVTFDDVTQLEKKKRELKSAKEDAESANQAKSDFLANMSHELRNPMNAIVGFTDILRRGLEDGPDTRNDYLNIIHASGTHLVGLINDILDLSKIEAGRMEIETCDTSPWQIVSEVVAVMSGKAQEQGLLLECNVDGLIPSVIQSDPTRLRQILMNLVGNAIKFTSEGSVRIVARIEGASRSPRLRFSITDTGIGMTGRQCDRIFEEFVQADSSVTRRFGGTGLGLAISKRLTEALGGEIVVSSEPGVGSTFSFSVSTGPLSGIHMLDSEEASANLTVLQKQHKGLQIRFKPVRVLVTDDTPANRKLVGLVLRKAGLTVDEAENGQQAVDMVMTDKYDLVLMDMQMPVMDGFTATSALRAAGLTLPIIALTANVMQSDRERCESSGCNGFLIKPIDIDQLLSTLAEYLELTDVVTPIAAPVELIAADPAPFETPTVAPSSDSRVLESTLPTDIPEFRNVVNQFINMLTPMMHDMHAAWVDRNFAKLQDLAHKLKGTGGTVGFADFTAPAERLERQMELRAEDEVEQLLAELMELSQAVQRSETLMV
ncbi:MAG: ATP-binding protein, partial [Fuerstiella sp.]|nr:ATP-binding protein [Fuerstiella sp.]